MPHRPTARFVRVLIAASLAAATRSAPLAAQNVQGSAERPEAVARDRRFVPLPIRRLDGPITIDGRVDEAAWDDLTPLPMSMFSPTYLGELTEKTEVRIGHDDRYVYVAGRLFDSNPAGIRTNTFYRDVYSGDDVLAVILDSYNDFETAVWFTTNPAGARSDRTVSNDGVFSGGDPMNSDWNAHWDVATTQDDKGWYAEFRIPFSTLRFQAVNGQVEMGLIVYRVVARKNERQTFPALDPKWGGIAFAKPSQSQRVVMDQVRQSKPVYLTPYVLTGLSAVSELGTGPDPRWTSPTDRSAEVGGDVRYSPTSNLALDFSVNTDFAQAEADEQQVNLTRFPLFFPEKRQFFQERASTFQFNWNNSSDRLFHSRRIGLDDDNVVRIYGGARAVGRAGGLDYGFLTMQSAPTATRPSENLAVFRASQRVFNQYSSIGLMTTSRLGAGGPDSTAGRDNVAYGLDAVIRPFGNEWVTVKWAQTFDQEIAERSALAAGSFLAQWQRVREGGLSYAAGVSRVGADFRPGLGFQSRTDYRRLGGQLQYKVFPAAGGRIRSVGAQLDANEYVSLTDHRADSRQAALEIELENRRGHQLRFSARSLFERVAEDFEVADATVPAGEYDYREAELRLTLSRSGTFRGELGATAGDFYDGTRKSLSVGPTWNPSRYLELAGTYRINQLEFPDRGQATTAHLGRLKLQLALNTKVSLNVLAQYSNVADLAAVNARFRYNVREGTDLWVVYNEGLNTDRTEPGVPRLPFSAGRSLLVKYTHTLVR